MSVGEKIQKHRKDLGLSQEELGKQLLVSRQTISLWEKDQTSPTIDNLIRLREIFGISVDEILGFCNIEQNNEILPNEHYRFQFTQDELNEIHHLQKKNIYKRPIIFTLLSILMIIFSIYSYESDFMIGFASGIFLLGGFSHIRNIRIYNKTWVKNFDRICRSTYEHKVFEDYITITIYRENEKFRESKYFFADIELIRQFGKWLFIQFGGQSFIIRKSDLKESSAFYSYMYKNPSKTLDIPISNKWILTSHLLFWGSLASILGALALVGMISEANGLFVENMWCCFIMTPIPIASIIFGFILKSKGYKYKKNIIAGFIMTFVLCIYGSFAFIF